MADTYPTNHEGIVFGNGHHLPGLEALGTASEYYDFEANIYPGSGQVAALPDHPDSVVRLQYETFGPRGFPLNEDGFYAFVRLGIAQFEELQRQGIAIPAQRFVVGPAPPPSLQALPGGNPLRLYTFTEKIEGRPLAYDPSDAKASAPIINGLSRYMGNVLLQRRIFASPPRFMYDLSHPEQFTKQPDGQVILHDVGLEITPGGRFNDKMIRHQVSGLALWSKDIKLSRWRTVSLQRLLRTTRLVFPSFDPEEAKSS